MILRPMTSQERKGEATTEQPSPLASLPDDLLLSCLARVSRWHYGTLFLVSKRFRSLIASAELYKIRSTLGRTESCLYVCFGCDPDPDVFDPRWFTLCRKPDQTWSSENVLVPTSIPHCAPPHWSGIIGGTLGDSYNVGGPIHNGPSSSSVNIEGRKMWVYPGMNSSDRKVYLTVGDFDTNQKWVPKGELAKTIPPVLSLVIREKAYMFGSSNGLAYRPKGGQWERFWGWKPIYGWFSCCLIEEVLYIYSSEIFRWYDTKAITWREVKGLKGLPKFVSHGFQLADYGGKLAVVWTELVPSGDDNKKIVWCAVFALERPKNGDDIWGEMEWCDVVCTVPKSYKFEYALDVIL